MKYQRALVSAEKQLASKRNRGLLESFIRDRGLVGEFRRYLVKRKLDELQPNGRTPQVGDQKYLLLFTDLEENFWCEWYDSPDIEEALDTASFIGGRGIENMVLNPVHTDRLRRFLSSHPDSQKGGF